MDFQWKKEWTTPAVGVAAFGIGLVAGYFGCKYQNKIERSIRDAIDEIGSDVVHLQTRVEEGSKKVLEASWDIIHNMEADKAEPNVVPEHRELKEGETSNVWHGDAVDHDWDYEVEKEVRKDRDIYILHRDEFDDDEKGYDHNTITYYKGDDILTDEHDVPVHNMAQVVGEDNLHFGRGSGDPHIVYIRNEPFQAEYEVILDHGFYQVEVLGQEIEDRLNVEKNVVPKFRPE